MKISFINDQSSLILIMILTLYNMRFFEPSALGEGASWESHCPHHNFVVFAPMIIKFLKSMKLDEIHNRKPKSLWRHYSVIMTS